MSQPLEVRMIPLAEIREPEIPVRAHMDDQQLESLVRSIRDVGIIEPLILAAHPDHFEIVAGHRRFKAAQMLGLTAVPAITRPAGAAELEAIKIHENVEREELNPAEEAIFYGQLLDKFHYTEEQMCRVVKRSPDYIGRRLALLRGDHKVLMVLLEAKVSNGVAEELNRIKSDKERAYYMQYAVEHGASVSLVRQWRFKANASTDAASTSAAEKAEAAVNPDSVSPPQPPTASFAPRAMPYELGHTLEPVTCRFCGRVEQDWKTFKLRACDECARTIFGPQGPAPAA